MEYSLNFRVFTLLICLLFIKTTQANEFLKKSDILNKNNVKVFAGEIRKSKLALDESLINLDIDSFYQVDKNGILKSKYVGVTATRGCGGKDYNAIGFNIQSNSSPLLIYKPKKDLKFNWIPAEKVKTSKCYKHSKSENRTSLYQINNSNYKFLLVHNIFARKLTPSEIQKDCGSSDIGCIDYSKNNDRDFLKLSYVDTDNCSSQTIVEKVLDMDGKNSVETSMSDFFGVLKIRSEKNKSEENWLIFNAPGYEGHGILGIEKKQFLKKIISDHDWTVYNGC